MALPRGKAYGVLEGNVPFSLNNFWLESGQTSITAFAGGGQTNAYQIVSQTARVTTVATAGDSVKLPPATKGLEILLINHGANAMQVYGTSADTIDDVAAATGVSQMANSTCIYTCAEEGDNWYSEGLGTGYAKALGLQTLQYASIAANSTGTQASGVAVTASINLVSSAGSAYSVTLPVSQPGLAITIACTTGTNTVAVFPNAGGTTTETINALSANAGITMSALTSATFVCAVAGQWYSVPRVPS